MKQKGFTLVELLAVIIVIGLLALLIIPKVKDTIKDSRKSASEVSTNALVRTATNYFLEKKANKSFESCVYDFTNNSNTCTDFTFSGKKPDSGRLEITKDGNVNIAVQFGNYCYIKGQNQEEIKIIDYNKNTCGKNAYIFTNYELPGVVTYGDGLYESELELGRYIYRGANPNNYIWLDENGDTIKQNEEIYRIISFESDKTIKVIRNLSIGTMSWDELNLRNNASNTFCNSDFGCNVWGNTNNTYYEKKFLSSFNNATFQFKYYENGASTNFKDSLINGTVENEASLNIFLNNSWLENNILLNYISSHNFNVGGLYYFNGYNDGDKGLLKEKKEISTYKWNGKIGLMDITDMVEASTSSLCTSVWSNYFYNRNNVDATHGYTPNYTSGNWPCNLNNWMYAGITEWTMTASSYNNYIVWNIYNTGDFSGNYSYLSSVNVRPAFYLKSSIGLRGLGTMTDPYEIVLE